MTNLGNARFWIVFKLCCYDRSETTSTPMSKELVHQVFCLGVQLCRGALVTLTWTSQDTWDQRSLKKMPYSIPPGWTLVETIAECTLRQLASCPELHSNQISLFPSLRFDNGFQIYWRWRSLLASSRLIIENWNTESFCWWFGGYVHLFKGWLPPAAGGTSPVDPAGHGCWTEQGHAHSVWKDRVSLPEHPLTSPSPGPMSAEYTDFTCQWNWRKYLIKPVNFYTDNKNVSTDINVNNTK